MAQLCAGLPQRLMDEFIAPLCISALNTVPQEASGQVFLTVLHDSLFAGSGGLHLLLPRQPLGALLPEPALDWLRERGHHIRLGQRVQLLANDGRAWCVDGEAFDAAGVTWGPYQTLHEAVTHDARLFTAVIVD